MGTHEIGSLDASAVIMNKRSLRWTVGAFLITAGMLAFVTSVVYSHDSTVALNLHAIRLATVTDVSRADFSYRYDTCIGTSTQYPPPRIGSQVPIFYNPNVPCQNAAFDPVGRKRSDLTWLLGFSVILTLAVSSAAWDFARHPLNRDQ